jgi:hypothetical protein
MKAHEQIVRECIKTRNCHDPELIRQLLRRHPNGPVKMAVIRKVLNDDNPTCSTKAPATLPEHLGMKTIALSTCRVSEVKPREGLKAKFFRLKRNTGYPIQELADEWGCTADTLRRDAKRLDAILYVEISPGEWAQCVVHPDTATERKARHHERA